MGSFNIDAYKNLVNGNNNNGFSYTSNTTLNGNSFGCASTGNDWGNIAMMLAGIGLNVGMQAALGSGDGGGSTAKTSAKTKILEAETKVDVIQKQIDQRSLDVMTEKRYNDEKAELERQMEQLNTEYKVSGNNNCETELRDFETASAAYDTAVKKEKEFNEYQTQLTQCIAKAPMTCTGKQIDPRRPDGGISPDDYNQFVFNHKDGNSDTSDKDKKYQNDLSKAQKAYTEYTAIKNKMDALGTADSIKAEVSTAKTAKESAEKKLNTKMGGAENGTEKSTAYLNAKKGIEQKQAELEIKYKGSAQAEKDIESLNTQLTAAKTELLQAKTYLEKLEQADDEVASAKAAKKAMKKNQKGDGNFFTRIFSKSQREQHGQNVRETKMHDERIAEAQKKRDIYES